MIVRKQLVAMGETVADKQFLDKLLNADGELSYLRPTRARAPIGEIVAGLTYVYRYQYQDRQHQKQHNDTGKGRFQCRHPQW